MEGYEPSTYGERFADVYDRWYAKVSDTEATVAHLVQLAPGGSALELGCGTGRLAVPLAAAGLQVSGLDASGSMLARCREASVAAAVEVRLFEADMAGFDLGPDARFDLVFVAFNTFFNIGSAAGQRACLASVARHLAPGGRFVVECFVPGDEPPGPRSEVEAREIAADEVILVASRHEPGDQTVSGAHIEIRESGVTLRPWFLRYAGPDELDEMALAAGLGLETRTAGWRGEPFSESSTAHVSSYRRRAGSLPS